MADSKLRIEELPPRARALAENEVSQIFGGCDASYQPCDQKKSNCCDSSFVCRWREGSGAAFCQPW